MTTSSLTSILRIFLYGNMSNKLHFSTTTKGLNVENTIHLLSDVEVNSVPTGVEMNADSPKLQWLA